MYKLGLAFRGLQRLLGIAIELSFTMASGAGGRSISPMFVYYPMVDDKVASAFRIVNKLRRSFLGSDILPCERKLLIGSALS